ncbi:MAG TPA: hypothetical protein ENJ82_06155, partial [Bacteroidetes bacterium]|nr:hypothetical protein [Bacteroidota bacterium]
MAENAYIEAALYDSLESRGSLKCVHWLNGLEVVGFSEPGIDLELLPPLNVGFVLRRGRKLYALKNHLGNV